MTIQTPEILLLDDTPLALCAEPLNLWEEARPPHPRLMHAFIGDGLTTSCHRGYVGHWVLDEGRLMLRALQSPTGFEYRPPVPFATIFPGYPDGVFAHWIDGVLRAYEGEPTAWGVGHSTVGERDHYLLFERGVLRRRWTLDHPADEPFDEMQAWYQDRVDALNALGIELTEVPEPPEDPDEAEDRDDRTDADVGPWRFGSLMREPGARIEPIGLADALALGRIDDAPHRVPALPFGHLNRGWLSLLERLSPQTSLHHVHVPLGVHVEDGPPTMGAAQALCVLRGDTVVGEFRFAT